MAYDKIVLNPSTLPTNTILRFIEIEISLGIDQLAQLFSYTKYGRAEAHKTVIHYLAEDKHNLKEDLDVAFSTLKFRKPQKEEMIQYFRYKGLGVTKIVKLTSSSPNTIQNYKETFPNYTPVFPSWLTFPVLLNRWEELKTSINIFDEKLIHTENTFRPLEDVETVINEKPNEKIPKLTKHAPLMDEKEANALYLTPFTELGMVKFAIATRGYLPSDYIPQIESGEIDISEVARYLTDAAVREKYQKD